MGSTIRKSIFPFEVNIEGNNPFPGKNIIKDIYTTELGYVMVSVFNTEKKVTVNYICGELKNVLPEKIKIKEEGDPRSSLPSPATEGKSGSSL